MNSANRVMYDECSFKNSLRQSVAPNVYSMDPIKYEHVDKCRSDARLIGGTNVSHIRGNLVDLENDLRGQTRSLSHCTELAHRPVADGDRITSFDPYKNIHHPVIDTTPKHLNTCSLPKTNNTC